VVHQSNTLCHAYLINAVPRRFTRRTVRDDGLVKSQEAWVKDRISLVRSLCKSCFIIWKLAYSVIRASRQMITCFICPAVLASGRLDGSPRAITLLYYLETCVLSDQGVETNDNLLYLSGSASIRMSGQTSMSGRPRLLSISCSCSVPCTPPVWIPHCMDDSPRPHHLPTCGGPSMPLTRAQTATARWREGKGREGEARRARKVRGRSRSPMAGHCPPATGVIATCATSDLLLKLPNETFATYV
jgi:hypothetical protein